MARKSYWENKKQQGIARRKTWSRNANAAKERKRLAEAEQAEEVGVVRFSGPAFGGEHEIRCMVRGEDRHLLLEIDGSAARPRTLRGLVRVVCRRLWRVP